MELKIMRIEVIKMTLQKRENSTNSFYYEIEQPLKIYGREKKQNFYLIKIF